jgi:hypothetical protein
MPVGSTPTSIRPRCIYLLATDLSYDNTPLRPFCPSTSYHLPREYSFQVSEHFRLVPVDVFTASSPPRRISSFLGSMARTLVHLSSNSELLTFSVLPFTNIVSISLRVRTRQCDSSPLEALPISGPPRCILHSLGQGSSPRTRPSVVLYPFLSASDVQSRATHVPVFPYVFAPR